MSDRKMIKRDFIASVVLLCFSLTVIVQSYLMPRLERRGIDPLSAPGVVPGMIGLVLLCLALILFIRSIRRGGYRLFQGEPVHGQKGRHQGAATRVLLTLVLSLVYAVGLLGRFDYTVSTAFYIFAFICLFEYQPGTSILQQKKVFILGTVQAVVASALITLVFQKLFLVDLP